MNAYFHQLSESTSNRFTVEASDLGLRPDLWPREFYRHALSIAGWRVEMGPIATAVTAAVNADYATETLAFYQNAAAHNRTIACKAIAALVAIQSALPEPKTMAEKRARHIAAQALAGKWNGLPPGQRRSSDQNFQ